MKIFVAGATGVLGRALVPLLVARGDEVVGMTRSPSKQDLVRDLGVRPVVADALDPDAVAQAVASAEPEVIVHELTALSGKMSVRDMRHPERAAMATMTNRLRTEATDHLLAAGRAVEERRPRFETSHEQQEQLATRFFAAAEEGDLEALEELLAHELVLRGDGGGKAPTIARAIHGRARVARTLIAGLRAAARAGGFTLRREEVNGQPGALFFDREGRVAGVMILDVAGGQIQGVSSIVHPDKLRHLGPVADLRALLRERR